MTATGSLSELADQAEPYWFTEIWRRIREPFIAIISHTLLFLLVMEIIRLVGYRIEHSNLPSDWKTVLEKTDHYLWVIVLVMMGVALLCDLLIHFAHEVKEKWKNGKKE